MSDTEHRPATTERPAVGRRTVLRSAAALGGAVVIAGCSSEPQTPAAGGSSTTPGGGTVLGTAADVPVGSGTIYQEEQVVVTQPSKGDFKAFTSICTHAGCPVATVTDTINCDCHGGKFSIEDGSVVGGPALAPLRSETVTVKGTDLVLE